MSYTLCFAPICSLKSPNRPGTIAGNSVTQKAFGMNEVCQNSKVPSFQSLKVKATEDKTTQSKTIRSIVCSDCDGNGAKSCTQCKGTGVNSVDHFNGQFKAGGLCWLCRGKKDILCGSCNGAGFLGGFMSTCDD
ncbi:hypothetical protein GLYMA_13G167200v4 [Glycine max]|uniref:BSD2 cysteine rich domain-containing protein n=1 Tax=Glycine max TaxID=3847 RepID=A0A368UH80_SOYBN|nr:protein BUNDLE SHEATH DEFECTIVE 2, chloroplastic isoform X1 [Glycine max]KAG4959797.1 hypothetical protein JHK87_036430 [Glycine soja]KAG4970822.1 hypothetical protein JHK85_037243 [Glycine max]KAG5130524.1 hypothetical protein JHK84_036921 [Glycine max]KAH1101928.1 hypothetical protein GYH30_036462 [Glycine max]RCW19088.1 hypothetical protein GLYMA_13G167200v4 [Glycine max]|eukprot:XP_003542679.1 uncharacterized protein LOC100788324 isoform X1 [Glycine max]